MEHGEVVIRTADLAGRDGLTDHEQRVIYIDHGHVIAGARAAICHELSHLRRGRPASPAHAAAEEYQVRRETARVLAPNVAALRHVRRVWTRAELAAWSELGEGGGDHPTVHDAAHLNTGEIPVQRVMDSESVA